MNLTLQQKQVVEANMGLVGKVIKDKVHALANTGVYDYDDLYQIGCVGLCKAAATDKGTSAFSTYAYRLIWNEICDALVKVTRIDRHESYFDPSDLTQVSRENLPVDALISLELQVVMDQVKERAKGVTEKGIVCLQLSSEGLSSTEIAEMFFAEPATVRMWMTKARRFLRGQPELMSFFSEVSV